MISRQKPWPLDHEAGHDTNKNIETENHMQDKNEE